MRQWHHDVFWEGIYEDNNVKNYAIIIYLVLL